MAIDVTGLAAWTDEAKNDLIRASLLTNKTAEVITIQPGIKSSASINILAGSSIFTQGGSCGFLTSGSTVLSQRDIEVCDIKKNESVCLDTVENFWTSTRMKPGSYNQELPFEQLYSEEIAAQVSKFVEQLSWQGNVESGSEGMSLCNGLLQVIDAAVTVTGSTVTALTSSNIISVVDDILAAIPADAISSDDLVIFMGYDTYRLWSTALRDANLFAYSGAENQGGKFEQMVPGTNVKAIGVGGLVSQNRLICGEASNFHMGTDLLSDQETFRIFFSEDNDEVRTIVKFKLGFQVAFPERIVINEVI